MAHSNQTPLYKKDTEEMLGFIENDGPRWRALTIFGYQIALTETQKEAETILKQQGLTYLAGTWQYYDKDDHDWFPCVIKDALEHKVVVNRTNTLGYIDPDDFKQVIIENPTENTLIKT